jgi:monoamine oxidase
VIDELSTLFGPAAARPTDYREQLWADEPWTAGCTSPLPPGVLTSLGSALRQPVGRVHWAGTETALRWTGYMDGAVRAGQRAAVEVADALVADEA